MLFAKDIMNKKPPLILQDRTSANAVEIMKEKNVEYLLVVNEIGDKPKKLFGVITPRELSSKGVSSYKMKDIMRRELTTVTEKTNMVHVLQIMKDKKIKNLPVIGEEDGLLKGLITHTSILNILTEAISVFDDEREGY